MDTTRAVSVFVACMIVLMTVPGSAGANGQAADDDRQVSVAIGDQTFLVTATGEDTNRTVDVSASDDETVPDIVVSQSSCVHVRTNDPVHLDRCAGVEELMQLVQRLLDNTQDSVCAILIFLLGSENVDC